MVLGVLFIALFVQLINFSESTKMEVEQQVIVVSLPEDKYYKNQLTDIAEFVHDLAEQAADKDKVIVLLPRKFQKQITSGSASSKRAGYDLGQASVLIVDDSIDLWMRDFGLGLPNNPVKFVYGPSYLSRSDARYVDNSFRRFLAKFKIPVPESDLSLDGGNVVDNGKDKVIVSDRFFYENKKINEDVLKRDLERVLGMRVAIIPDPEDSTGHADGVVSFIDTDVLLIADYCDAEYYKMVEDAVKETFPELKIIKVPCQENKKANPSKKSSKWRGFSSAVGAYVNILLTDSTVYVPAFGDAKLDNEVLDAVKANTTRLVKSVNTAKLSHMGGSIRCMTWQLRASHALGMALMNATTKLSAN